jgi:hypothetical protein
MFKNLSLKNVKSFKQVDIALSPFTLVLGTNATGKSNLRDAFRFLHGLSRGYRFVDLFAGKYEGGEQVWSGIRGGPYEFIHNGAEHFEIKIASVEPQFLYHILVGKYDVTPLLRLGEALYTHEAVYDIGRSYNEKVITMGVVEPRSMDEAALMLYASFPEDKFPLKKCDTGTSARYFSQQNYCASLRKRRVGGTGIGRSNGASF